jgi:hypothetical protein
LPSLFRFLLVVGVLAALVYGGMIALVAFVKVEPREITQTVTLPKTSQTSAPAEPTPKPSQASTPAEPAPKPSK